MTIFNLLLAYGICFGAMNKVDFLHGKLDLLDRLLKCSYCMGFHAGWIAWLVTWPTRPVPALEVMTVLQPLGWALASAAFSYGCDTTLQLAESWIRKESNDE